MESEKKYPHVYYVESSGNLTLNPIAIRPRIIGKEIIWEDTARGMALPFTEIEILPNPSTKEPKKIEIITPDSDKVVFLLLTVNLFNQKARQRVAGNLQFKSDQDLQNYYLRTNFYAYSTLTEY